MTLFQPKLFCSCLLFHPFSNNLGKCGYNGTGAYIVIISIFHSFHPISIHRFCFTTNLKLSNTQLLPFHLIYSFLLCLPSLFAHSIYHPTHTTVTMSPYSTLCNSTYIPTFDEKKTGTISNEYFSTMPCKQS
jgi:hypothetical protein